MINTPMNTPRQKILKAQLLSMSVIALFLSSCSGSLTATPPAQPTPEAIQALNIRLLAISSDPIMTWQIGNYSVRSACHAYLNAMAARSANINLASGSLGLAGPAAAGFLVAGSNPMGAAAAGAIAALGQTFLNLFNSSGSIPYTAETSGIIQAALDAYEGGVNLSPPSSIPQAISYIDDLWWQCSAGGYAILVSKAISTANIGVQMNGMFSFRSLTPTGRPVITVNPPPTTTNSTFEEMPLPRPRLHRKIAPPLARQQIASPEAANLPANLPDDLDKLARLRWLKATWTCVRMLDGTC